MVTPTVARQRQGRQRLLGAPLILLTLATAAYLLANSAQVGLSTAEQVVYGLFAGVTIVLVAAGLLSGRRTPALRAPLAAWAIMMALTIIQLPFSRHAQELQGIVDFVVMLLPAILALALGFWVESKRQLANMLIVMTVFSFISAVAAWATSTPGLRYAAPPMIAIVGSWILATATIPDGVLFAKHPHVVRVLAIVACLTLFGICLGSRERTAIAAWVACALAAIALVGVKHASWKLLVGMALGVGLILLWRGDLDVNGHSRLIEQARLETIVSGQYTQAGGDRLREIHDVGKTMQVEASPLDYTVGFGHGATYVVEMSYGGTNLNARTERGHQIHIVPVMVCFRYGILGLILFAWLMFAGVRRSFAYFRKERDLLTLFLLLLAVMYFGDMLLRNSFVDPVFALTIAMVAVYPQIKERHEPTTP